MKNNLRLEDFLRAYAEIHEHTLLNTQALEVRMRMKQRKPFALVIGRTCGIRIDDINMERYYRSMSSLRHSLDQHRTVIMFCVPKYRGFVRLTPDNYAEIYAAMDPVRVNVSNGGPVVRPKPETDEDRERDQMMHALRECVDYLRNRCLRTERQRPKHNRVNNHGFQRTFAANELMSRY